MPATGSPKRKHKHKHRSRSRSPEDRDRHKKKHVPYDSDSDTEHDERKRHRRRGHQDYDSDDPRSHHRAGRSGEDRPRNARVKQEPEDRGFGQRRIKREPGIKQESASDDEGGHRQEQQRSRQHYDRQRRDRRRQRGNRFNANEEEGQFGQGAANSAEGEGAEGEEEAPVEKEKPNFELSGKLTEETNTFRGVVIKYSEPAEARKPKKRWRLYPFKDGNPLPVLHIHRQSAFLMGRDRKIADIPIDHPSCSKQHSVLQFRLVPYKRDDGRTGHAVRPYIIDLGSTNGTHVNNQRIENERYVQLFEKDVLKFGFSSREYVLLHDASKKEPSEDDGESN